MVAVFLPPLWLSLLPIIGIETYIVKRYLCLPLTRTLVSVALGNLFSTIIGIPALWVVHATLQVVYAGGAMGLQSVGHKIYAVTVQAAWLIPYENDLNWMVPLALLTLTIPAYILSVLIEWPVLQLHLEKTQRLKSLRIVAFANTVSYLGLALLFAAIAWYSGSYSLKANPLEYAAGWLIRTVFWIRKLILEV